MTTDRRLAPLVIIGLGNSMRRDDGVGPAAVARLMTDDRVVRRSAVDVVLIDGEATRLIESWRGREQAIVIDAARTGADPGTILRLVVGIDPMPTWATRTSSHSAGLLQAIELARALDLLPPKLTVFGVEARDFSMGDGLSAEVEAALPELVSRVIDDVVSAKFAPR